MAKSDLRYQMEAATVLNSLRADFSKRLAIFNELGGLADIEVQNTEWLYMLTEETRNSLSIEGYFATEQELEAVIQGKKSYPEVLNYFRCAQSIYDLALQQYRERQPVVVRTYEIKHIHSELFRNVSDTRGIFRVGSIQIQRARIQPPDEDIPEYVASFIQFCNDELLGADNVVRSLARIHTLFESIHPFRDGNGRAGRILTNYLAVARGLPPIIIKGLNDSERGAYYSALEAADLGLQSGFPIPTASALRAAIDRGNSDPLEALMCRSLVASLDPLIISAMERKDWLLDFASLALRMSVQEATVRKWRQRKQILAIKRGRRYFSHPLLYLGDVGLPDVDVAKQRLQKLIDSLRPRVHHITIESNQLGATFFAERTVRLYLVNVAPPGELARYSLFAHNFILDTIDLGQPILKEPPEINVSDWTDAEIEEVVLFPSVEAKRIPSAYSDSVKKRLDGIRQAFYPLVSTIGVAELVTGPSLFKPTRVALADLRKLVAQTNVTRRAGHYPSSAALESITNVDRGIQGVSREGRIREAIALDANGLFVAFSLFPNDTFNDNLDSPNRNLGIADAVEIIDTFVSAARLLARRTVDDPSGRVFLRLRFAGLRGRPLHDDTGYIKIDKRRPGDEDSAEFPVDVSLKMLESMADDITIEATKRLFWALNHDEVSYGAVASILQQMKRGLLTTSDTATQHVGAQEAVSPVPELRAFLQIGESQNARYFLTGEIKNLGQGTAYDVRGWLPKVPKLVRPQLRPNESWTIRVPYDSPTLGGDFYQQGVLEFSFESNIYRQETVVDLSILPGGNLRGYKLGPLTPPRLVDSYSIPAT